MVADAHDKVLVIGAAGGVGNATLNLFAQPDAATPSHASVGGFVLVDARPCTVPPALARTFDVEVLAPCPVQSAETLRALVDRTGATTVWDLAGIDTRDATAVCDELGARFLTTAIDQWPGPQGTTLGAAASLGLLPATREQWPRATRRAHGVGMGMNPGAINLLVRRAIEMFAARVGVDATTHALDLHGIYLTELDTTARRDVGSDDEVLGCSWHPEHFVHELLEPHAIVARSGAIETLPHRPVERSYVARCGDREVQGMVVPHDEIVSLARRYTDVELAYLYQVCPAALSALRHDPGRAPEAWPTRRDYPPHAPVDALSGSNRLGVLLASRRHGEMWLGYETHQAQATPFGTNPVLLQVAAGVLVGHAALAARPPGLWLPEDLDPVTYFPQFDALVGAPKVVYDATADARPLAARTAAETLISESHIPTR